jgi:predicted DNA-binding transcriptional regulator AlpA
MSLRGHKKKPRANEALRGLLADGDLRAIRARIEADFAKNVELKIETFIHPIVEGVAQGRLPEPVHLGSSELGRLAAAYCHTVREAVGAYAKELVQAVANRRRTGSKQLQLVMQEANRMIRKKTSPETASALIDSIGAYLQVADSKAAEDVLADRLKRLGDGPVKKDVAVRMRHAVALYGGEQRLEPTPTEKVENPALCQTMTFPEVMEILKRSRSTVHRYLDEGRLKRAALRGAILTASVAALLKESL